MGAAQGAGVLVPVYRDHAGELRLVVVRRAPGGAHGGQLAFPGGKREAGDETYRHTALRETREEVGLAESAVNVLAELPQVDTLATGFRIFPFLGRIRPPERWRLDPREIAEIFELSLARLARPEAHGRRNLRLPGWSGPRRIGFYRVGEHELWGASYRILEPLLPRLLAGEWEL